MVELNEIPEKIRKILGNHNLPEFETAPWPDGPPFAEYRIALIPAAGLHRKHELPFVAGSGDTGLPPDDAEPGVDSCSRLRDGRWRTFAQAVRVDLLGAPGSAVQDEGRPTGHPETYSAGMET